MKRSLILAPIALLGTMVTSPVKAVPGGQLRVLIQGPWRCEMPGDATVLPVPKTDENFRITADSSYIIEGQGVGNYLRLGDRLTMTSGPFSGRRYRIDSEAMVHRLNDAGNPTDLRCVRSGVLPNAQTESQSDQ